MRGAMVVLLMLGSAVPPDNAEDRDLLGLRKVSVGPGVPDGWKVRPVRGHPMPDAEIRCVGNRLSLRLNGAGRAGWFYRETLIESSEADRRLHWSWRVDEAPAAADLGASATDDSPIRIYVVFGKVGGLFGGSGRVIFYSFGNHDPGGYSAPSHVSDRLHVIRVDGVADRGRWREHAADPFADYRRIWQKEPPPITAIGVMQDTDQTGDLAVAELRRLEWASARSEDVVPVSSS